MIIKNPPTKRDGDKLYELHVKPLEKNHYGKFIVVSPEGKTILGDSAYDALEKASILLPKGNNFVFKVGEKVIGHLL